MFSTKSITFAVAGAALLTLGAGTAHAADWPAFEEGAYVYTGPNGTGNRTVIDLVDDGACHTLPAPAVSVMVINGSKSLELHTDADCTAAWPFLTGSLMVSNLPRPMLSYRVVPA